MYKEGIADQYITGLLNQVAQASDDAVTAEVCHFNAKYNSNCNAFLSNSWPTTSSVKPRTSSVPIWLPWTCSVVASTVSTVTTLTALTADWSPPRPGMISLVPSPTILSPNMLPSTLAPMISICGPVVSLRSPLLVPWLDPSSPAFRERPSGIFVLEIVSGMKTVANPHLSPSVIL